MPVDLGIALLVVLILSPAGFWIIRDDRRRLADAERTAQSAAELAGAVLRLRRVVAWRMAGLMVVTGPLLVLLGGPRRMLSPSNWPGTAAMLVMAAGIAVPAGWGVARRLYWVPGGPSLRRLAAGSDGLTEKGLSALRVRRVMSALVVADAVSMVALLAWAFLGWIPWSTIAVVVAVNALIVGLGLLWFRRLRRQSITPPDEP